MNVKIYWMEKNDVSLDGKSRIGFLYHFGLLRFFLGLNEKAPQNELLKHSFEDDLIFLS